MARLAVGLSALVFAAVVALLWVQRDQLFAPPDDPAQIATPDQPDSPPESILSAIETLESASDAKCHSSANRFEDFIYGTPLADEGRWANVDLQKRWVQRIWTEASEAAARAGEAAVSPQRLREQIEQWFDWSEASGGQIEDQFGATDHRQCLQGCRCGLEVPCRAAGHTPKSDHCSRQIRRWWAGTIPGSRE